MPISHLSAYLSLVALEIGLVFLVRRGRVPIRELIGGRWDRAADVVRDIALAAGMWAAWLGAQRVMHALLPASSSKVVGAMLPSGPVETIAWIALSCTAGFAEELAFRGYLQRRFGVAIQAVLFGIVHGYQGVLPVIRIAVYGLLFGAVARWRKSLRPGMIAHAWTDIAAGILRW